MNMFCKNSKIGIDKIITIIVVTWNNLVVQCINASKTADGITNSADQDWTAGILQFLAHQIRISACFTCTYKSSHTHVSHPGPDKNHVYLMHRLCRKSRIYVIK